MLGLGGGHQSLPQQRKFPTKYSMILQALAYQTRQPYSSSQIAGDRRCLWCIPDLPVSPSVIVQDRAHLTAPRLPSKEWALLHPHSRHSHEKISPHVNTMIVPQSLMCLPLLRTSMMHVIHEPINHPPKSHLKTCDQSSQSLVQIYVARGLATEAYFLCMQVWNDFRIALLGDMQSICQCPRKRTPSERHQTASGLRITSILMA